MSQASNRSARPRAGKGKAKGGAARYGGGATRKAGSGAAKRGRGAHGAAETARACLYDAVTQRIVGGLEAGRLPWVQPWGRSGGANVGLPRNAASKRAYSGINVLILWGAVIVRGYPSQDWLTFAQTQKAGGAVRKGERGVTLVYADRFTPEAGSAPEKAMPQGSAAGPRRTSEAEHAPRAIPFLKRFTVFNVAQCDGLSGFAADLAPLAACDTVAVGEELIRASGVEYRVGGDEAFYAPIFDFVAVPPQPAFFHPVDYYRTALHELTHATGHASRLGRDLGNGFGSKGYAREELIAELGSAFLCASLGIEPTVRHADYLGAWLEVLKADNRAIFRAASAASKAADWLLARLAAAQAGASA